MNKVLNTRPPGWFWAVAALLAAWNAIGAFMYIGQVTADPTPLAQAMPLWATSAFAIAVFGGLLGAIGLLSRKAWVLWLFWISLAAIVVQQIWNIGLSGAIGIAGLTALLLPAIILIVAIYQIWLANHGTARGWLR